jgi:hypothetical protein
MFRDLVEALELEEILWRLAGVEADGSSLCTLMV